MPGYLYIVSVMSAGLLSVLLLALRTEATRCTAVEDALAKLPGIRPERRLPAGRRALVIDDRHQALCVICAETQTVRLHVVPFGDLHASELLIDGKSVSRVERGTVSELVTRRRPRESSVGQVQLRIEVRDRHAPIHELKIADLRLAKYWHSQLRAMIAATEPVERIVGAAAPQRLRAPAAGNGERRAALQPGIARKPNAQQPLVSAERRQNGFAIPSGSNAKPVSRAEVDNRQAAGQRAESSRIESPQLRAALRRYLNNALRSEDRVVISERKLRDACAPQLPLIRFHEQMNRLRRAKALADYRLSYRRKSETWRISRADDRRAAAA